MRKKITFFALGSNTASTRRITVSQYFLFFLCVLAMAFAAGTGYVVYDYAQLRHSLADSRALEDQVANQKDVIALQNRQIQKFAAEINELKNGLISLNKFEKKVRIIANLEEDVAAKGLFGVGGSIPEDLEPRTSLRQNPGRLIREMHEQMDQLEAATEHQTKSFENLLDTLKDQRNLLACTPAIRPANGWITSNFGYRTSPFTGLREFHKGLDIANRRGTPILATADGVVATVGRKGLLGKVVIIDHGYGIITRYAHIDKALVKRGDRVKRGNPIAHIGNTGRTTGTHVHYEVIVDGIPANPEKYILN